jgi:GNAT superfamily N-acetyltransferase
MSITATTSLALRIDHCELTMVTGMAEVARAAGAEDVQVWPIAGGAAVLAGPGSPFNKVCGAGFAEPGEGSDWERIEREHDARRMPIQVELSTLNDPRLARMLTARGYHLVGFENVLALRLTAAMPGPLSEVDVALVGSADAPVWRNTVTSGFLHPDVFDGPPSHESFDSAVLDRTYDLFGAVPGVTRLLARRGDEVAGGASLYLRDGVALMCGAATLPAHRRRGVQAALLHARIAHAAATGCELAVVTTQPGSKSQENVQRAGFELIYSRAILVREPNTPEA